MQEIIGHVILSRIEQVTINYELKIKKKRKIKVNDINYNFLIKYNLITCRK